MDSFTMSDKKKTIIATTWEYLLKKGLANASIGDLCREAKLAQSSLYYWFDNKDDIWISAGKYGLSKVVDKLFAFTLKHTASPKQYFDILLEEIDKYKTELRCVIQITVSPVFGKRMRETMKDFNYSYADYAKKLMEIFNCTFDQAEIFIYSTLSAIVDYAVWDDGEKTQLLLDNLYNRIIKTININGQ
ncbi:MAG: TetR/AcrR family transcriptional regulator [Clostridia bacterium]|nr:TetR/AcrR family transcriptional regulator [Clostridia bacterium]